MNTPSNIGNKNLSLLLILIPFLMGMAVDLYVPSLPAIRSYFHAPETLVQLSISSYMLSYSIGQIFLGILSDSFGRKKIIVGSAAFFTLASIVSAFAPNIYILILMRFFQGIGTAGMSVAIRAAAAESFTGVCLSKVVNSISISWSLGPIIGPFIGGYLQHYFNWQANFYFFALYCAIIFILSVLKLPETNFTPQQFNLKNISTSIITVTTHPIFLLYALISSLTYGLLVIFNTIGPFLIQTTLQYSAAEFGHVALLLGFAYFAGNTLNRLAINRFHAARITIFGFISALFMGILLLALGLFMHLNLYVILLPIWFLFLALGLVLPNVMGKIASIFPNLAGTASAVSGAIIAGGVAVEISLATMLKTTTQVPMAITYLGILSFCFAIFFVSRHLEKNAAQK